MRVKRKNFDLMKRVKTVHTAHQSLEVWKSLRCTEFRVAGATHAWYHQDRFLTGQAWDMIAASALMRGDEKLPKSILMLGLAGGTAYRVLRHLLPDAELVAVDIDREIVDLARKEMALDQLKIEVVHGDAYAWLAQNRRRFDVVIDDIYLAGKTDVFRPKSWNRGLMKALKRAVAPGGVLAVNLVIGEGHRLMQSQTRRVLKESFPTVRTIRSEEAMNEVLVAGESVATPRRLREFADSFVHWRDRQYWDRLEVKKL